MNGITLISIKLAFNDPEQLLMFPTFYSDVIYSIFYVFFYCKFLLYYFVCFLHHKTKANGCKAVNKSDSDVDVSS